MVGALLEVAMSKKCTPLWREAHFQVKMYKTHHSRTTFGSWDVEKVQAVVARSRFPSENVQNPTFSDHFWQLRCWKSARRCGAKHMSKSKCTKHQGFGPLLEVRMSKKCTPLWREGHFEVNMFKTLGVRTTFGGSDVASLQYTTLQDITLHYTAQLHNYTPLHSTTLFYTKSHYTILHYTPLHYTTLHYTTLHYLPLHFTTLHHTTLQYATTTTTQLHSTTIQSTTLNYTTLHYITLHYTTFRYTSLHYTTLHSTTLQLQLRIHNYTPLLSTTLNYTTHYITLHYTTFQYTPLHYTILHYTTLHWMTLHHR